MKLQTLASQPSNYNRYSVQQKMNTPHFGISKAETEALTTKMKESEKLSRQAGTASAAILPAAGIALNAVFKHSEMLVKFINGPYAIPALLIATAIATISAALSSKNVKNTSETLGAVSLSTQSPAYIKELFDGLSNGSAVQVTELNKHGQFVSNQDYTVSQKTGQQVTVTGQKNDITHSIEFSWQDDVPFIAKQDGGYFILSKKPAA